MKKHQHEIEEVASRLFMEMDLDADAVADRLFNGTPGPGARRQPLQKAIEFFQRNWDNPPRPEWRADELDRYAPRDPKSGTRPLEGLAAFNTMMRAAFPDGRPADPPPEPPPSAMESGTSMPVDTTIPPSPPPM